VPALPCGSGDGSVPAMKKLIIVTAVAALAAFTHPAVADGMPASSSGPYPAGNCPHPAKPSHPVTARKKKPAPPAPAPSAPPVVQQCSCPPGPQGPEGPPGPSGPGGSNGVTTVVVERAPIGIRLGVMGTVYAPHGDWGWGPALQLTFPGKHAELALEAGLAGPLDQVSWSPGRQPGVMLHIGVAGRGQLSWSAGLRYDHISGSEQNGYVSGDYLALDAGLVFRQRLGRGFELRVQAGPTIGGLRDTYDSGTQFIVGLAGGAFIGGSL
jgi:hypothetical protein